MRLSHTARAQRVCHNCMIGEREASEGGDHAVVARARALTVRALSAYELPRDLRDMGTDPVALGVELARRDFRAYVRAVATSVDP